MGKGVGNTEGWEDEVVPGPVEGPLLLLLSGPGHAEGVRTHQSSETPTTHLERQGRTEWTGDAESKTLCSETTV